MAAVQNPANHLEQAMTDNKELLPCPFCGYPATNPENVRPDKRPLWEIKCRHWCDVTIRNESKQGVIKRWNTRPQSGGEVK